MKIKSLMMVAIALLGLTATSCKKEKVKGCTASTATNYDSKAEEDDGSCKYEGTVTFWMDGSVATNGEVDVVIDGVTKTITIDFPSGKPSCNENGCASFTLPTGTYTWIAEDQSPVSYQETGTITIEADKCTGFLLN